MSKPKDVTQKTFQPHLLLVMAEMTEWTAGAEVKGEDTFKPVCERMGITEEEWGTPTNHTSLWTHRLIGFAMKNMRDHGWSEYRDRGIWTLTEEGVKAAMGSSSEDNVGEEEHEAEQEVLEVALAKSALDMASDLDEEDLDNLVELEVKKPSHPYSDDPYIRSLAIAQTGCFGAFAQKSPICKECSLQAECVGALHQSKSALAETLDAKEAAERRKREAEEAEARRRDESVDELMNLLGDDPPKKEEVPSTRTPGVEGKDTVPQGKTAVKSTTQREALCHHCKGKIQKDSENWWIKGVGVYHLDCLEVPDPK